jgi:hypothetical protein
MVAASMGLPLSEVRNVARSFWDAPDSSDQSDSSPMQQRMTLMQEYWSAFCDAHANQKSGMNALWGLVPEDRTIRLGWEGPNWYNPRQATLRFPDTLINRAHELWGTILLPRWPERLASEIAPLALLAEAIGPALTFWQGCALTAWFVCEGPYSRTDIPGLESYYEAQLTELSKIGCPVAPSLFSELQRAHTRIPEGAFRPHGTGVSVVLSLKVQDGKVMVDTQERGSSNEDRRREYPAFGMLRKIIDKHRAEWTKQYLDIYLKAQWESAFARCASDFSKLLALSGKQPAAPKFARVAERTANYWVGGNLGLVYRVIGERSPVDPEYHRILPRDPKRFAVDVLKELGGELVPREAYEKPDTIANDERLRRESLAVLAIKAVRYVQLQEAMGRRPTVRELGKAEFVRRSVDIDSEPQVAWGRFEDAIERVLSANSQ